MPSSSSIPASEPSQKVCPTTEACWRTRRSGADSESRRAASTACTVSGSVWTSCDPSSRIRLTISSANRGLPAERSATWGTSSPWPFGPAAVPVGEQGGDQLARLVLGQRLERDRGRVAPPAAPARAAVEQLVASQADDQGGAAHPARQVLDQVEHALVGPVDVLERDHHRVLPAHRLDQGAHRGEQAVAGLLRVVHVVDAGGHRVLGRGLDAERASDRRGDSFRRLVGLGVGDDRLDPP